MRGAPAADVLHHVPDLGRVALRVDGEAEAGDLARDGGAQLVAALADAAGEDEGVDAAAEGHVVGADVAADAVGEQIKRQPALGPGVDGGGDLAEVGGARERLPAPLLVEDLLGDRDVQLLGGRGGQLADVARVVEHEARVHAAAARGAREPRQGGQAHAGVPAAAAPDGARASAAAEVQGDDVEVRGVLAEEAGDGADDEGITDAVEAVLPELVVAGDLGVDGVGADVRGDGGVELGVEVGDVEGAGQLVHAGLDDAQRVGVVQRRQVRDLPQVVVRVLRDDLGRLVVAAVDHAVARYGYVALGRDLGQLPVPRQHVEDSLEGVVLALDLAVRRRHVFKYLDISPHVRQLRRRRRQTAYLGLGQLLGQFPVPRRVHRDLDGARPRVDG